jgi:SAM-dependent methyltransferase
VARDLLAHLREIPLAAAALDGAPGGGDDGADPRLWRALSTPRVVHALQSVIVRDAAFQRLITGMRRAWALGRLPVNGHLHLACALSAQCFRTGYVLPAEEDELAALRGAADALPLPPAPLPAGTVALLGAYLPLGDWDHADRVAAGVVQGHTPELAPLVRLQLLEPRREAELRDVIPSLLPDTPDPDPTTRAVAAFYEFNPYPRWQNIPAAAGGALVPHLRSVLPHASVPATGPPEDPELASPDVLVAGCGTGLHPLTLARRFPGARVTAVDLSRASLAYGARRAEEEGVGNVRFVRADLADLHSLGRTFHLVESVGVLQHLPDPAAGWRALVERLKPGGFMKLGVYAAAGREPLLRARRAAADLAARILPGHGEAPLDHLPDAAVRRLRTALAGHLAGEPRGRAILHHPDWFTLGEFRDLILHPHEVHFTIPDLAGLIRETGLRFLGFTDLPPGRVTAPDPGERTVGGADRSVDLSAWEDFEAAHPEAFGGLYTFWCHRPR